MVSACVILNMNSPIYSDSVMELVEIEPGLTVYRCSKSGGIWMPLQSYLDWKKNNPESVSKPDIATTTAPQEDSSPRALVCPESGRLLIRYKVGHGLPFYIERSPATGGIWLDRGEWEALKSRGLHLILHQIFSAEYQRQIRTESLQQTIEKVFKDKIGEADFSRVQEFGKWLSIHPKRGDICRYLMDKADYNDRKN